MKSMFSFTNLTATIVIGAVAALAMAQTPPAAPAGESKSEAKSETPKLVYVEMTTNKGPIVIELNHEKAPISVDNFLSYVDKKFYDGTVFHRVISTFMIQGGGFTADLVQKPTEAPIKNEWQNGLKNTRGTIAMARTNAPDSATSQFFINVVDNPNLDQPISGGAGYAVFGKVVAGMKTVDTIKSVPVTTRANLQNVPVDTVLIEKVVRISPEDAKKKMDAEAKPDAKPQ